MGLFFTDFRSKLERIIADIESSKFQLPEDWSWWDRREETLYRIEGEDLEIISIIKKLYRKGHTNRRLTSEILRRAIELKEDVERMLKKPDYKLQAQHVNKLLSELDVFLREELSMETLGVEIKNKILYWGSTTPGIISFRSAEEDTIGEGIYLTDEKSAIGYARYRVGSKRGGIPTVYKFLIEHAWLADFSNNTKVKLGMQHYAEVLKRIQEKPGVPSVYYEKIKRDIKEIEDGRIHHGNLRDAVWTTTDIFTKFLKEQGYDGLIGWEGGEGGIGNHISYVVFNPQKAKLLEEIPLVR